MNVFTGNSREKGFTLIEILIALAISAIVMAGVYGVYETFIRHVTSQDLLVEAQQNGRAAIDLIQKDLAMIGHRVPGDNVPPTPPIEVADAGRIQFRYADTDPIDGAVRGFKIEYGKAVEGGVTYLYRKSCKTDADFDPDCTVGAANKVISNLQAAGLTFLYYDGEGGTLAPPDDSKGAKFIKVTLVTETRENLPTVNAKRTFEVHTEVRLRNIDISSAASDTSAPAQPTGLQSREVEIGGRSGICGQLKLKWTKGSEGDLAGYKIFYTLGTSTQSVTVPLSQLTDDGTSYFYTLAPTGDASLQNSASDGSSTATYTIGIRAYDNSSNFSVLSDTVSDSPDPSNYDFDSGDNDTTINPAKPGPVTGFQAADGAAEGQVALSWSYDTASNPGVVGFRLFRNTTSFTSYPVSQSLPDLVWVAGATGDGRPNTLSETDTTYTDSGSLVGCQTYYYAIVPMNCDSTLVSDDAGDDDSKRYVATDYAGVCGDGSGACTPGVGMAAVSDQDTAPPDATDPASPGNFGVRAGWRRVAVSFTQPSANDIEQTCVYTREGGAYAVIDTDPDMKDAAGCYAASSPGRTVPDSGGAFDITEVIKGASKTFWHDDWNLETPVGNPSLTDNATYSYSAVAFDRCGRGSAATDAQATTTLCGQDPPVCVAPETPATADCVDAADTEPPAVTGLAVECCDAASGVSLTWTAVSSDPDQPSSYDNPWDLAGYRIFRSTNDLDWSAATLLNPDAPWWPSSYNDASTADGNTYYYRVVSTDCPYEKDNPDTATIRGHMIDGTLKYASVGPVSPGGILRDERCVTPASCSQDDHRAVLTGIDIDNSDGTGTGGGDPLSTYTHETVTLFFENTSADTQTIKKVSVDWTNASAYLRKVTVGGGRSGETELTTNIPEASTSVLSDSPYTRTVSGFDLSDPDPEIDGLARYVPITFTFWDADDAPIDMRDDQLRITLVVKNDSTGKDDCLTYLTTEEAYEGIVVPRGASITSAQQDQPVAPTFGYSVPGASGLNTVPSGSEGSVAVSSGTGVNISADVSSLTTNAQTGNKVGMSSVKLYYDVTLNTVTSASSSPSDYTEVDMTNTDGNIWDGSIPAQDGFRVWYYIIGIDEDGNFDRDPEIGEGAYTYDQREFDACDVTPEAPTNLSVAVAGADVGLSWTATEKYTSGADLHPTDSVTYRIYRGGSQIGADQAGTVYTDVGLANGVYSYNVKALNSCAVDNLSAYSNNATACVGVSGQALISVSSSEITAGGSYTVTILDCLAANAVSHNHIDLINSAASDIGAGVNSFKNTAENTYAPLLSETGAVTATFTTTVTTATDTSANVQVDVSSGSDTIAVYYLYAFPNTVNVTVNPDPCTDTPVAPASLSGSISGQNMALIWPQTADWDRYGYKVWEKAVCDHSSCGGVGTLISDWFVRDTVYDTAADPLSRTYSADKGTLGKTAYSFKITTIDTCATPNESTASTVWNE